MLARSIKRPLIRLRADYGELTGGLRGMPTELRSRLTAYFEPYNRELYRWLGREFDWA
jgi:hypothetical protein